ncbi:MAG: cyclodeaminase/cyclohydrolase family protein [Candidatus Omnitrophica bacterium]|jgi:formiminotetrahydrofolate cyclodeaminase|nr:cyclodeaminase/cyclohydrolase family protein [Candidatus Omnitrophota bacterium]MDD5079816.1 cyclodeaminase/cyclohydrolase family protein [Candidatus Omnitrophota bacterium]
MYGNHLKKYLDDLAGKLPAPGGGSAAAMSAALGSALISMVLNFTVGKPKYAEYESQLKKCLDKSEKLRLEFLHLVDLDVTAYSSKDLRKSMDVPLMVCRLCFEAIDICPLILGKSNQNLISDVAVAAVLLESAFFSAYVNVDINLKYLNDPELAKGIRKELDEKGKVVRKIRQQMEVKVGKIIRG